MQLRQGCKLGWLVIPALILDRVTKLAARRALFPHGVRTAVEGLLSWAYTENRGAAFSMLSGRSAFLIVLTSALVEGIALYLISRPHCPCLERVGLWLVAAGGLGNLWDRLAYGYVIDFIRLDFVRFAIFNLADVFVSLGAVLVFISVLLGEWKGKAHVG